MYPTEGNLSCGPFIKQQKRSQGGVHPKQGKIPYTKTKSYGPISHTSFLLRTLKKIIDRNLKDSSLDRLHLHKKQYAYQSGKSYERAIHELVWRVEIGIEYKEIALDTFLISEGTFDGEIFLLMERVLQQVDRLHAEQ
ncbi:hypothetical protein Trydic_g4002 [Trypoxylus dichotomus]